MKIYFLYLFNMSKLSIETAKNSVNYKAFTEEQLQYLDYERMNETITKITFPTIVIRYKSLQKKNQRLQIQLLYHMVMNILMILNILYSIYYILKIQMK